MQLAQSMTLAQDDGSWVGSVFPDLDLDLSEPATQRALGYLPAVVGDEAPPEPKEYRSVVDWILCVVVPPYRKPCSAFYAEEGERLVDVVSDATLDRLEVTLRAALQLAARMEHAMTRQEWRACAERQAARAAKRGSTESVPTGASDGGKSR